MAPFGISETTLGTSIRVIGGILLLVLLALYIQFQARNIILGPTISLTGEYVPIQHERSIVLSGDAHNVVKLTLNGNEIHTNQDGGFTQMLVLENGYTIMSLNAQDRFGRTTSLMRGYVYVPLPS
ncbi:MAG: hypothetical protein K9M10_00200 [Candidatus Pacebacteria bacterium]|nr:hypothetical protein [Candidatus Paceibacterota bacterium]MCF7856887.1 hypothetical protein [Candidatus Paceibacterota bacterium]